MFIINDNFFYNFQPKKLIISQYRLAIPSESIDFCFVCIKFNLYLLII